VITAREHTTIGTTISSWDWTPLTELYPAYYLLELCAVLIVQFFLLALITLISILFLPLTSTKWTWLIDYPLIVHLPYLFLLFGAFSHFFQSNK